MAVVVHLKGSVFNIQGQSEQTWAVSDQNISNHTVPDQKDRLTSNHIIQSENISYNPVQEQNDLWSHPPRYSWSLINHNRPRRNDLWSTRLRIKCL